ncbi:MAG: hypothetical protein KatS3mg083_614 [Candidatus Dojkabacteria bacterium]|nr:MAG: hypothetical protein KatS3mg083_614 [Candidatus Dojkabacteria bacterium]
MGGSFFSFRYMLSQDSPYLLENDGEKGKNNLQALVGGRKSV